MPIGRKMCLKHHPEWLLLHSQSKPLGEVRCLSTPRRRRMMEQQRAETNGCEDGVSVLNHTETAQVGKAADRHSMKHSNTSHDGRSTRNSTAIAASGRSRRHGAATAAATSLSVLNPTVTVTTSSPPPSSSSSTSERRVTRHSPSTSTRSTRPPTPAEKKMKNLAGGLTVSIKRSTAASLPQSPPQTSPTNLSVSSPTQQQDSTTVPTIKILKTSLQQPTSGQQTEKKRKRVSEIPAEPPSPRLSKRLRLQYQPFQSPDPTIGFPAICRQLSSPSIPKPHDDKIIVFHKGEFLAVRNEVGDFYVCRTAQNVYKSSRRFKIQWMNNDSEADIYSPDFYDHTDFECVLTNLRMRRVDKNKYLLPSDELKRTQNILQRALNVENGMDIPDPRQVVMDGVDVSIVGKEEEEVLSQGAKKPTPNKKVLQIRGRGRPRKTTESLTVVKKNLRSSQSARNKPKTISARFKSQSRDPAKLKLTLKKVVRSKVTESKKKGVSHVMVRNKKTGNDLLHPNPKVTVYEEDPFFETNMVVPFISTSTHSKLLIRAVILRDIKMLQSLIDDTEKVCSLGIKRSIHIQRDALSYAVQNEDPRAMRALMKAERRKYASPPDNLLGYQGTGYANTTMLGHAVRSVTVSRGGREGNNAFLKDDDSYQVAYPSVDNHLILEALKEGVSIDTLNLLLSYGDDEKVAAGRWMKQTAYRNVVWALRRGHRKLAGQLIDEAVQKGGFGFNILHKEVLVNDRQPLTTPLRPASVMKKCQENARVLPIHCAAINPNNTYLSTLMSVVSEYNVADKDGWKPIHYAAVCEGTGPLEYLLSRGISPHEIDSDGNTPLHQACQAGRHKNVDMLLRHSTAHSNKKNSAPIDTVNEKFGVGGIDRPNKSSFTPLHIAAKCGHLNVVQVLMKHRADVQKTTSAAWDKLTAMMLAAQQGHLEIIRYLVEQKALVEAQDKRQRTALTHAIMNGHTHIASYLLRLGANPNTKDSSGNTLVHYAVAYGWFFCLKVLLEAGASPNLPNDWKMTPLSVAFMKGHMGLVDYLIENSGVDININVNDEDGMTLVMQAVRSSASPSMLERVRFLVEKQNADCTKVDFCGNNALHHLVHTETEFIKRRRNKGELEREEREEFRESDPEAEQEDEQEEEEEAEDEEEVKEEWESRSSEARRKEHNEQMMLVEDRFSKEIQEEHDVVIQQVAKLLLDHGCDPKLQNREGESPFSLAFKHGSLVLAQLFLDAGCQLTMEVNNAGENLLHSLVQHSYDKDVMPFLQTLLKGSGDPSPLDLLKKMAQSYNTNGYTALHLALSNCPKKLNDDRRKYLQDFIKFLIVDLGSDVTAPIQDVKNGHNAATALHLAVSCPGGTITELLLMSKPSLDQMDKKRRTPLVLAILKGNQEAANVLVTAGANVNVKAVKDGNLTPLLFAAKNGQMCNLVATLCQHKANVHDVDPATGNTALHYAVKSKASDAMVAIRALIDAGANVNAVNNQQRTPLHLAVDVQRDNMDFCYEMEELLLERGAKTDIRDCRGRIPLHYAFVKIGNHMDTSQVDPIELVVLLTRSMGTQPVDVADNFGQTPLHCAASRGATISCSHLVHKKKNLDAKDKNGNTPLGLSVLYGHSACSLMLLQEGASCIAELVIPPPVTQNNKGKTWEWQNLKTGPAQPVKCTVLQEVVSKDWQGILYLMLDQLESSGKGLTLAIEAALRTEKYYLALKLISRIKQGKVLYNEKQSMLHLLAKEAKPDKQTNLQLKVCQALLDKGIPVALKDEHNSVALIYAAMQQNIQLCQFITDKMGMASVVKLDPDKSLRTIFSALFWWLTEKTPSSEVSSWMNELLKAGASPNVLSRFPLRESAFPGVYCQHTQSHHEENASSPKLSPLIVAILRNNWAAVQFLLNHGADVNFCDDQQRTPIMHAVRLNNIRMVKLLLNPSYDPTKDHSPWEISSSNFKKTSSVDLSKKDSKGWTVVHHLVCPIPHFTYDSIPLLQLLAQSGAPLATQDNMGLSPLQMALNRGIEPLVNVLQDLLAIAEDKREKAQLIPLPLVDDGIHWEGSAWDFKQDSSEMLKKIESEIMEEDKSKEPMVYPDELSGMKFTGVVAIDASQDMPYDVLLTYVDLGYGTYGLYNFYKMQIIHQTGKDLYILFNRWGRVGDTGQYQKTPFPSLEDAAKEFAKIFKSKSGNSWEEVKRFTPMPKKYRLVQLEKRIRPKKDYVKPNLECPLNSKLPDPLQKLMKNLMDVGMLQSSIKEMGVVDTNLPLGQIPESTLRKAESLLEDIRKLVVQKEKPGLDDNNQKKLPEILQKIADLSEEFYHLVPVHGYEYESLQPLFSSNDVRSKMDLIHDLLHMELTGELLLGAQLRLKEVNPVDYVYRSLGCRLQILEEDGQEAQMILQYIHNTANSSYKPKVEAIFRVDRDGEEECVIKSGLGHHELLWHGTKPSNVLSILSRGLQIAPLGAEISGDLFGKGIYFADMFQKSKGFCYGTRDSSNSLFMLLCEVALGKMKEIDYGTDLGKETLDSVKALGTWTPDPSACVFWNGRRVPMGEGVQDTDSKEGKVKYHHLQYNEYVVYKPSQVCIRYLVQFRG